MQLLILHNHSHSNHLDRVHATKVEGEPVINCNVDGSCLYQKQQKQATAITASINSEPPAGWESITADNSETLAKIPPGKPGSYIHIVFYG